MAEELTVAGTVLEIERQDSPVETAKPWTRWRFNIEDTDGDRHWYSWFAQAGADIRQRETYRFAYELKDNPEYPERPYRNIKKLLGVGLQGGIDQGPVQQSTPTVQTPQPETPQDTSQPPTRETMMEAGYARGFASNAAVTLIGESLHEASGIIWTHIPDQIRKLRDRLYHEVFMQPIAPPHYCYQHEAPRVQSPKSKNWGHLVAGQDPCVEE